jgi:hypothetical protein
MGMENHGGMMSTEKSCFFHHSCLAIQQAESSGSKQEEWAMGIIALKPVRPICMCIVTTAIVTAIIIISIIIIIDAVHKNKEFYNNNNYYY